MHTPHITGGCFVANTGLAGSDVFSISAITASGNWWGRPNGPIPSGISSNTMGGNALFNVTAQSPSNTPEDCISLEATCEITLVEAYPGVTQEFGDMRAGVDPSSQTLSIHSGPTINAQALGTVPWSIPEAGGTPANPTELTVVSRLQFPVFPDVNPTEPTAGQVWYEVELPNSGMTPSENVTNMPVTGWILARVVNFEPDASQPRGVREGMPREFRYVEDGDPCGNVVDEPETLTFTYDRVAAARYAMAHAYRNSLPDLGYPTQFRVTIRIASEIQVDDQPIPYVDVIPYAPFSYSDISGQETATGSAAFLSQSIWMGGLPLTYDLNSDLQIVQQNCGFSGEYGLGGWRYCPQEAVSNGQSTKVWNNHQGVVCYYSEAPSDNRFLCSYNTTPITDNNRDMDRRNIVIPEEQHGEHVGTFRLFDPDQGFARIPEVSRVAGNIRSQGGPRLDSEPGLFYESFINPDSASEYYVPGLSNIQSGDYVFVMRSFESSEGHGYLVAGWGDIMSCPMALSKIWTFEDPQSFGSDNADQYRQLWRVFSNAPLMLYRMLWTSQDL